MSEDEDDACCELLEVIEDEDGTTWIEEEDGERVEVDVMDDEIIVDSKSAGLDADPETEEEDGNSDDGDLCMIVVGGEDERSPGCPGVPLSSFSRLLGFPDSDAIFINHILPFLDIVPLLLGIGSSCRHFRDICTSDRLWQQFSVELYVPSESAPETELHHRFIELLELDVRHRREEEERRNRFRKSEKGGETQSRKWRRFEQKKRGLMQKLEKVAADRRRSTEEDAFFASETEKSDLPLVGSLKASYTCMLVAIGFAALLFVLLVVIFFLLFISDDALGLAKVIFALVGTIVVSALLAMCVGLCLCQSAKVREEAEILSQVALESGKRRGTTTVEKVRASRLIYQLPKKKTSVEMLDELSSTFDEFSARKGRAVCGAWQTLFCSATICPFVVVLAILYVVFRTLVGNFVGFGVLFFVIGLCLHFGVVLGMFGRFYAMIRWRRGKLQNGGGSGEEKESKTTSGLSSLRKKVESSTWWRGAAAILLEGFAFVSLLAVLIPSSLVAEGVIPTKYVPIVLVPVLILFGSFLLALEIACCCSLTRTKKGLIQVFVMIGMAVLWCISAILLVVVTFLGFMEVVEFDLSFELTGLLILAAMISLFVLLIPAFVWFAVCLVKHRRRIKELEPVVESLVPKSPIEKVLADPTK